MKYTKETKRLRDKKTKDEGVRKWRNGNTFERKCNL